MVNQPTPLDISSLRFAIRNMDLTSQSAFSEIASIAKLSLAWLEIPDGYRDLSVVADALNAIWYKAESAQESISVEAEAVSCEYIDQARIRRARAAEQAQNEVSHE